MKTKTFIDVSDLIKDRLAAVLDINQKHIHVSEEFARNLGFKNVEAAIGKTNYEMPCKAVESAPLWEAQNQQVIKMGKSMEFLDVHQFAQGWRILQTEKTPLKKNKECIGLLVIAREIHPIRTTGLILLQNLMKSPKKSEVPQSKFVMNEEESGPILLTSAQQEVLYFFLQEKKAEEIAQLLALIVDQEISVRIIEKCLTQLQDQFQVASLKELQSKAEELGYLSRIPESLLFRQFQSLE